MMDKHNLKSDILNITDKIAKRKMEFSFSNYNLKYYSLLSANLLRLMPEIRLDEHKEIYKNMLQLIEIENTPKYLSTINLRKFFVNLPTVKYCENKIPSIYVSFHLGAYRTAVLYMVRNSIDFAIVVDTSVTPLEELRKKMLANFSLAKETFPESTSQMNIVSANDKRVVTNIIENLNKKFSILTFIDWNFNRNKENVIIDFFNCKISVDKCIAYISFYLKVQIIPLMSYYDKNYDPSWIMFNTINPNNYTSIIEYAQNSMQELYTNLQDVLKKYYCQWKGWFKIHNSIVELGLDYTPVGDFEIDSIYIKNRYVEIFVMKDSYLIMNKFLFKIISLTKDLFDILTNSDYFGKNEIDADLLRQLYDAGMISKYSRKYY